MRVCISSDLEKKEYAFLSTHSFELVYWSNSDILLHDHVCLKYISYVYPNENRVEYREILPKCAISYIVLTMYVIEPQVTNSVVSNNSFQHRIQQTKKHTTH